MVWAKTNLTDCLNLGTRSPSLRQNITSLLDLVEVRIQEGRTRITKAFLCHELYEIIEAEAAQKPATSEPEAPALLPPEMIARHTPRTEGVRLLGKLVEQMNREELLACIGYLLPYTSTDIQENDPLAR